MLARFKQTMCTETLAQNSITKATRKPCIVPCGLKIFDVEHEN